MQEIDFTDKIKYLSKFIWFDKKYNIKHEPYKIIAYAMRDADFIDYPIIKSLGDNILCDVLKNAQPGWFDAKSWNFWHIVLKIKKIPPLPKRAFNSDADGNKISLRKNKR